MSTQALLIKITLLDNRYHGQPEWPPSPFRLFQALVAGAARGANLADGDKAALKWLENLEPPTIAAPVMRQGLGFTSYVPNNDLDSVGGDPDRIAEIRTGKHIRPLFINPDTPFFYIWSFADDDSARENAEQICTLAEELYQFGRGVDMAFARTEILAPDAVEKHLEEHGGTVHRPSKNGAGTGLSCPQSGSLVSLLERHHAQAKRYQPVYKSSPTKREPNRHKFAGYTFSKPSPARFQMVSYDCPPAYLLFDIRKNGKDLKFRPQSLTGAAALVKKLRDKAAEKLKRGLDINLVDRMVKGLNATEADKTQRIRIVPLPSIGFLHADRAIRRVLVEVPPDCPIPAADIEWAFSGLAAEEDELDPDTGEIIRDSAVLVPATDRKMLKHYAVERKDKGAHVWHTVTPVALPAARRRTDPARHREEAKSGKERAREESQAAAAISQALRHAGISQKPVSIRVQRVPFEARGEQVEDFAHGRFGKKRLWHAKITFAKPLSGPLIIGDGRYLGLGLMAPAPVEKTLCDFFVFDIRKARLKENDREGFLYAVRSALMALDRDHDENAKVSRLFSGHEPDGAAARSGTHDHVFLAADSDQNLLHHLYVIAPWKADRTRPNRFPGPVEKRFNTVVSSLELVRAGKLGLVKLKPVEPSISSNAILGHSTTWQSHTPYIPTHHRKNKQDATSFIEADILVECRRRSLPKPEVRVSDFSKGPRGFLQATISLKFTKAVEGPLLLGQNSHYGGGLFRHGTWQTFPR